MWVLTGNLELIQWIQKHQTSLVRLGTIETHRNGTSSKQMQRTTFIRFESENQFELEKMKLIFYYWRKKIWRVYIVFCCWRIQVVVLAFLLNRGVFVDRCHSGRSCAVWHTKQVLFVEKMARSTTTQCVKDNQGNKQRTQDTKIYVILQLRNWIHGSH